MTSNALNSKRQYLPKAKVCKPVPPPPPPGYVPPASTCLIIPTVDFTDYPADADFEVQACNVNCPKDEEVPFHASPSGGSIGATEWPKNCGDAGSFLFDGPPGTYHISVTFFFSNGDTCNRLCICHMLP